MYKHGNKVYFSTADEELISFLKEDSFEKSLIYNVLFQPGIVISDNFYFSSSRIENHILNSNGKSLIEQCISKNIIIPALRSRNNPSFIESLNIMKGKGNSKLAVAGIRDSANKIANRLQVALEQNPDPKPIYWPENMGEKFNQLVIKCLMNSSPLKLKLDTNINEIELRNIWELTKIWRIDCIKEAQKTTREIVGNGLRRSEILKALMKNFGIPSYYKFNGIKDLLRFPSPKNEKNALKYFLKWICYLYYYNFAKELGIIANFPSFDILSGLVLPGAVLKTSELIEISSVPIIEKEFLLPSIKVLKNINPTDLLAIRESFGEPYFNILRKWQERPSIKNADKVYKSIDDYSKEILNWAKRNQPIPTDYCDLIIGSNEKHFEKIFIYILTAILSTYNPSIGLTFALTSIGYQLYLWGSNRPKKTNLKIKAKINDYNSLIKTFTEVNLATTKNDLKT